MKLYFMKTNIALREPLTGIEKVKLDYKLRIYVPADNRKIIETQDYSRTYYLYPGKKAEDGTIIIPNILFEKEAIARTQFPFFNKKTLESSSRLTMPKIFQGTDRLYIYGCGDFMFAHPENMDNIDKFIEIKYLNEMR